MFVIQQFRCANYYVLVYVQGTCIYKSLNQNYSPHLRTVPQSRNSISLSSPLGNGGILINSWEWCYSNSRCSIVFVVFYFLINLNFFISLQAKREAACEPPPPLPPVSPDRGSFKASLRRSISPSPSRSRVDDLGLYLYYHQSEILLTLFFYHRETNVSKCDFCIISKIDSSISRNLQYFEFISMFSENTSVLFMVTKNKLTDKNALKHQNKFFLGQ